MSKRFGTCSKSSASVESMTRGSSNGKAGILVTREPAAMIARFVSNTQIKIDATDEVIEFEQAIIAAGSRVTKIPAFPFDDPRVMDSTDALDLEHVPKRLLIIGGGIIGLEMATVYEALGSEITVVELSDQLIAAADKDIVNPLFKRIKKQLVFICLSTLINPQSSTFTPAFSQSISLPLGVRPIETKTLSAAADKDIVNPLFKRIKKQYANIFLSTEVTSMDAQEEGIQVGFKGKGAPEFDSFDKVLVSIGRTPNGKLIDCEKAGVNVDDCTLFLCIHTGNFGA
jgi:pyruvate/2-oxoglutarate dehydrogenase complex dihydrolipoamide dehydrogenase (E3) component